MSFDIMGKIKTTVLCGLAIVALSACKAKVIDFKKGPEFSHYIVGSYTGGAEQGVYTLRLDHQTGELTQVSKVVEAVNPSYVVWHDKLNTMYSVNEVSQGGLSGFSWDADAEAFKQSFSQQKLGDSPCHISISPDSNMLAVANYMSSDIEVFNIRQDASLDSLGRVKHYGQGPHSRQEAPHPHWIKWGLDGRFIYTVDLGIDQVTRYQVRQGGALSKGEVALKLQDGDGPRHMVFHPRGKMAYLINELSNTVVALEIEEEDGDLVVVQRLSSLAPGFNQHSQAAAIKISDDGRFLYISNRGANTIAIFKVDKMGLLSYLGEHTSAGDWPRDISLSKDGDYLLVANESSNRVNVLRRDKKTGLLNDTGYSFEAHKPTAVQYFPKL